MNTQYPAQYLFVAYKHVEYLNLALSPRKQCFRKKSKKRTTIDNKKDEEK